MMSTACTDCRAAGRYVRTMQIAGSIHATSDGRFVIAQKLRGQFVSSMTDRGRRLTGCSLVFARTVDGVAGDPTVRTYRTRGAAVRALKPDEDVLSAQCARCRDAVQSLPRFV